MEVFNPNSGKKGLTAANKDSNDPEDMMLKGGFDAFGGDEKTPQGFDDNAVDFSTATPVAASLTYYEKMPFIKQVLCSFIPPAYYKYKGISREGYIFFVRIIAIIYLIVAALVGYIWYSNIGMKKGIVDSYYPNFRVENGTGNGMLAIFDNDDKPIVEYETDVIPFLPKMFPHFYANTNIKEFVDIENETDFNNILSAAGITLGEDIKNPRRKMIVMSRTNYLEISGTDWKIKSYEDLPSAVYDRNWIIQKYEKSYRPFVIIGLVLALGALYLALFFGYRLIAFIYSIIAIPIAAIERKKVKELDRLKACGYAMVPSVLVLTVYAFLPEGAVSLTTITYAMIACAILPILIVTFALPNLE